MPSAYSQGKFPKNTWREIGLAKKGKEMSKFSYDPSARIVPPGTVIETVLSGSQSFGSGGYSARTWFYGTVPEELERRTDNNQFTCKTIVRLKLMPDTLVVTGEGDCIGEGRDWDRAWICAEPEALARAKAEYEAAEAARIEAEAAAKKAAQRAFALDQAKILTEEHGISADRAWAIIKSGGAGVAVEAVVWAEGCVAVRGKDAFRAAITTGSDDENIWQSFGIKRSSTRSWGWANANYGSDAIELIQFGRGGRYNFGKDRMACALVGLGYDAPPAHTARRLSAVLDAAKRYMDVA